MIAIEQNKIQINTKLNDDHTKSYPKEEERMQINSTLEQNSFGERYDFKCFPHKIVLHDSKKLIANTKP